jgi:PTS system mannitol-specific IIC component
VFVATGAGLVATPSPGSIFAEIAMSPRGGLLPVLLGIGVSAVVSFAVAAPLVRRAEPGVQATAAKPSIVFVCEAGMGSSVMGQSILQRKLNEAGLDIRVEHAALSDLPPSAGIVVANRSLVHRLKELAPDARVYAVDQFIRTPVYDQIIEDLACASRSKPITSC